MSPASINYKADWCIVVVAIKVPDSVTDEHALLLAAMKCHVMALGREGDGCDVGGTSNAGFVVQSAPRRSGIGDSPGYPILKDASLCVNLDWLFGHLNSVVWFFG